MTWFSRFKKPFQKFFLVFVACLLFLTLGLAVFAASFFWDLKKTEILAQNFFFKAVNNRTENLDSDYQLLEKRFRHLKDEILLADKLTWGFLEKKFILKEKLELVDRLFALMPEILAQDSQKTYFVLLQNNMEIRPSGGFMGSYAKLRFKNWGLEEVMIQDIYVPDGQIVGHVDPPLPILQAFKHGFWKLRDANWDPDFPTAAKTISWFFQKGNEEAADGIMAVNLATIQKILKVIGRLYLVDYNQEIDSENIYQIVQSYSEIDFFPGSTQKKDILSALGKKLLEEIKNLDSKKMLRTAMVIYQELQDRQIFLFFENQYLKSVFSKLGWDGALRVRAASTGNFFNDQFYLVEANLGANKANCCLKRWVSQIVDFSQSGTIKEKVKIDFENQGKYRSGVPPFFWGGTYINYLRVFIPAEMEIVGVRVNGEEVKKEMLVFEPKQDLGLQSLGFFVEIPTGSAKTVELEYLNSNFLAVQGGEFVYKTSGFAIHT